MAAQSFHTLCNQHSNYKDQDFNKHLSASTRATILSHNFPYVPAKIKSFSFSHAYSPPLLCVWIRFKFSKWATKFPRELFMLVNKKKKHDSILENQTSTL